MLVVFWVRFVFYWSIVGIYLVSIWVLCWVHFVFLCGFYVGFDLGFVLVQFGFDLGSIRIRFGFELGSVWILFGLGSIRVLFGFGVRLILV